MIQCPACQANIDIDTSDSDEGNIVECPECDVDLEIKTLDPLTVVVYDEEEDFEDESDEEEEG